MADQDRDPHDRSGEEREEQRRGHRQAEVEAHHAGQLHVAHPHPGRIGEGGREEEARRTQGSERPLRTEVARRAGDEDDDRGRQDDPVRNDPMFEVDRGDRNEHRAEKRSDCGLDCEAEGKHTAREEERSDQLDGRIDERDAGPAIPAAATQHEVRDQRDVVQGPDLMAARHAGRGRTDDGAAERHACRDDVQEAAERESGREDDRCEGEVHAAPIGNPRP